MSDLKYKILYFWYRLCGQSDTQAQWKARTAGQTRSSGYSRDANDKRYICTCGQLCSGNDKACPRCGRRNWMPHWLRRLLATLGLSSIRTPPGTLFLLVTIFIGYLVQCFYGSGNFFTNPSDWSEYYTLGASMSALNLAQPWRALTYSFLHGGLAHIIFNSFALVQVGPLIESRFGTARLLFTWYVSAMVGVFAPMLFTTASLVPTVGASGAIFGLIGMAMLRGHLDGDQRGILIRNIMIRWTAYTTIFGILIGGVAHGAHFGGLIAGALIGVALPPPDGQYQRNRLSPYILAATAALVLGCLFCMFSWNTKGHQTPTSLNLPETIQIYQVRAYQAEGESLKKLQKEVAARVKKIDEVDRLPFLGTIIAPLNPDQQSQWNDVLNELVDQRVITLPKK